MRARHDELPISGSCDGKLSDEEGAEIKSIGSKGYAKLTKAKPEHEKQATIYGALLNFSKIRYIYMNKETADIADYPTDIKRALWHKQATRATHITKTVEAGELPPRIDKEYICDKCAYQWKCKPKAVRRTGERQRRFR